VTTALLLIPSPQHASLLDGGPCGFVPPTAEAHGHGEATKCPLCSSTGIIAGRNEYEATECACGGRMFWPRGLVIWHNSAPALPGLWLLQAAIQEHYRGALHYPAEAIMHSGPYTETESRDILALAESLGIGEGVETENQP